jgi:hypothetical protein
MAALAAIYQQLFDMYRVVKSDTHHAGLFELVKHDARIVKFPNKER